MSLALCTRRLIAAVLPQASHRPALVTGCCLVTGVRSHSTVTGRRLVAGALSSTVTGRHLVAGALWSSTVTGRRLFAGVLSSSTVTGRHLAMGVLSSRLVAGRSSVTGVLSSLRNFYECLNEN